MITGRGVIQDNVERFDDRVYTRVAFFLPAGRRTGRPGATRANQAGGAVAPASTGPDRVSAPERFGAVARIG
jgi:hypothetical protein